MIHSGLLFDAEPQALGLIDDVYLLRSIETVGQYLKLRHVSWLFPLDGGRWLGGDVINDAIDLGDLVDQAV